MFRVNDEGFDTLLSHFKDVRICIHSPEKYQWDVVERYLRKFRVTTWFHGFESRDAIQYYFGTQPLKLQGNSLHLVNEERRATLKRIFANKHVKKIFVSRFMKSVAEEFAGTRSTSSKVIPNVVSKAFEYHEKSAEHRLRILWIRSFATTSYANDISQRALLELSKRAFFKDVHVTIRGDGHLFSSTMEALKGFPNIDAKRGVLNQKEIIDLHRYHGIMLVPTRFDSQGLSCCEAMASGLVPITTRIAAVPEFVTNCSGILCPPEDPKSIADAIEMLYSNPQKFLELSRQASRHIRRICSPSQTILKEVRFI